MVEAESTFSLLHLQGALLLLCLHQEALARLGEGFVFGDVVRLEKADDHRLVALGQLDRLVVLEGA